MKAIYENSFCMDSKCINYFEDMCMLCMAGTGQEIQPYDLKYIENYGRGKSKDCKSFALGCFLLYEINFEEEI